ncbi:hypothetical protein D3C76_1114470 [compost metagenome]
MLNLPACPGVLGQDVDFLEGTLPGIRVARIDGFQARQFGVCPGVLAENHQPAHLPGQAIGLQAFQAEFGRVLIESLDIGQGFLMIARQPLHIPQHLHYAQHRIRNGDSFQDIDPARQQLERGVNVISLVQHFAQQRSG